MADVLITLTGTLTREQDGRKVQAEVTVEAWANEDGADSNVEMTGVNEELWNDAVLVRQALLLRVEGESE